MEFSRTLQRVQRSFEPLDYDALKALCLAMAGGEEGEAVALDWERIAPDGVDGAGGGRTYADLACVGNVQPLPAPPLNQGGRGLNPVAEPFVPPSMKGPPPPTRVAYAIKNPERIDPDVASQIRNITRTFDVEQVIAICAGARRRWWKVT